LPYNQGNQQFDGHAWYWLTTITILEQLNTRASYRVRERVYLKPVVAEVLLATHEEF
jgi:hypothetical protein